MTKNLKDLGLSTRIYNTLTKAGVETVEQLCAMTFDELKAIKGISDKSAEEIQSKLAIADVVKKAIVEEAVVEEVKETKEVAVKETSNDFNEETTYIFTKKRYIKCEGRKSYQANKEWVKKLNGRTVDIKTGTIGERPVSKKWCISK